jgi:hypothetical protein
MTKNITTTVTTTYESPLCDIVEIKSEGLLCNSFEAPEEYDKPYEW